MMNVQRAVIPVLFILGGCGLFDALTGDRISPSAVEIVNQTADDLYVLAMTSEMLSRVRLAFEVSLGEDDRGVLAPGGSREIDFGDELGEDDTVVFVLYAPPGDIADSGRFRLTDMLRLSYDALKSRSFRVEIAPADLKYGYHFGDDYEILTDVENYGGEEHPPRIEDGTLHVWVSYGGCLNGTFSLREQIAEEGASLRIYHSYPDVEVDCDRLNFEKKSFELSDEVLARNRIVLLNPNVGADPYADAFVLRP